MNKIWNRSLTVGNKLKEVICMLLNFSDDATGFTCSERSNMSTLRKATIAGFLLLVVTMVAGPIGAMAGEKDSNRSPSQHHLLDHQRVQAMKERVAELKERIKEYKRNHQGQQGNGNGSDGTVAALQAQVTDLQSKVATLTSVNDSTLNLLQTAQGLISSLQARVSVLESNPGGGGSSPLMTELSKYLSVDPNLVNGVKGPHVIFKGVNVHVRSGSGFTDDGGAPTGLGNLIVGYNEGPMPGGERTGSHNIVGGSLNSFYSYGGLVVGSQNTILGQYATVHGGLLNRAQSTGSSILGGMDNFARFDNQTIP